MWHSLVRKGDAAVSRSSRGSIPCGWRFRGLFRLDERCAECGGKALSVNGCKNKVEKGQVGERRQVASERRRVENLEELQ